MLFKKAFSALQLTDKSEDDLSCDTSSVKMSVKTMHFGLG